nr:unnamed protein product [Callosobruchus analis]
MTNMNFETSRVMEPMIHEDTYHPSLSHKCYSKADNFESNVSFAGYKFKKGNFIGLYNALTYLDWSFLETACDANNTMCNLFYEKL